MTDGIYLDNDVVIKLCVYQSAKELVQLTGLPNVPPAILGVGKYTVRNRIERSRRINNRDLALVNLATLLACVRLLEPNNEELIFAADLETRANERGLPLDAGESQLVAIMLARGAQLLATGDKRAIVALSELLDGQCANRIACLEQIVLAILGACRHDLIRSRICAERGWDRALDIIFSCSLESVSSDGILDGMRSYIEDLRRQSGPLLVDKL